MVKFIFLCSASAKIHFFFSTHVTENFCQMEIFLNPVQKNNNISFFGLLKWKNMDFKEAKILLLLLV